ncbi:MAG TPA: histidine kinase dimerization/phospho-acceptor domain-containing protein [Gemmatimonadales bacterium]|nr:histidine kinase dimerization/phospho-acceptor domain-containing protein [Gemmatimonadales bacterium]
MALSRVRLRLTAGFAIAFLIGLVALNTALFAYLRRQASRRVTTHLQLSAEQLLRSIHQEQVSDQADRDISAAAREVLGEWPDPTVAFRVFNADGTVLGSRGDSTLLRVIPAAAALTLGRPRTARGALARYDAFTDPAAGPLTVVVATSIAGLVAENDALLTWMVLSAPLVLLLSLSGGYLLSRFALTPVGTLARAVADLPPDDLERRLPVTAPPDEIDQLAAQFNDLLHRLHQVHTQNRRFLEAAAHQLRTPLTLVLGESQLALEPTRGAEERLATLRRIQLAAQQMRHRVSDLFLLARAQAGERPQLADAVDLDGLVFEGADLFRARAHALGRALDLGTMDAAEVTGDAMLLREAVMELLENACRHSTGRGSVHISVSTRGGLAVIAVENPGAALPGDWESRESGPHEGPEPRGLGLALLRWIAGVHGGGLSVRREGDRNVVSLELPFSPR